MRTPSSNRYKYSKQRLTMTMMLWTVLMRGRLTRGFLERQPPKRIGSSCCFSTTAASSASRSNNATAHTLVVAETTPLLRPSDFYNENNTIAPPKHLSPSSIKEFLACPQSFFFQYVLGLKQPTTPVLVKGSLCHKALENIFSLQPDQRNLENLQNLFRKEWALYRVQDQYKQLHPTVQEEIQWGQESLQLLQNYWKAEDASQVAPPNPVQRETWIATKLDTKIGPVLVRGIVDRLDLVRDLSSSNNKVVSRLIDYKSGKCPQLKYSAWMNEKIRKESFEQLIMYALLLRQSNQDKHPMVLRYLRLFYLTSHDKDQGAQWLDMDLGATEEERNLLLDRMHDTIAKVWQDIHELLLESEDPFQSFQGCDRSFCWCHKCRPKFVEGSVWTPPPV